MEEKVIKTNIDRMVEMVDANDFAGLEKKLLEYRRTAMFPELPPKEENINEVIKRWVDAAGKDKTLHCFGVMKKELIRAIVYLSIQRRGMSSALSDVIPLLNGVINSVECLKIK